FQKKRVTYYLRWIALYHAYCQQNALTGHLSDSVTSFASYLAKDHEDWQVLQAKEAVRLFIYFTEKAQKTDSENSGVEAQQGWADIYKDARAYDDNGRV
ncbi:MAG: hypothetical protein ABWK15_08090, partial [Dissulfuribacterales bacterium]